MCWSGARPSMISRARALALLVGFSLWACHRSHSPAPASSAAVVGTSVAPSVGSAASANPEPSASSAPSPPVAPALLAVCEQLRDGMEFAECNTPPASPDFPDCRRFALSAPEAMMPGGCPPGELSLSVTGYPGIAESFDVKVTTSAKPPYTLRLSLIRVVNPMPGERLAPNTLLAMMRFAPGKRTQLLPGPGLKRYTSKPVVLED